MYSVHTDNFCRSRLAGKTLLLIVIGLMLDYVIYVRALGNARPPDAGIDPSVRPSRWSIRLDIFLVCPLSVSRCSLVLNPSPHLISRIALFTRSPTLETMYPYEVRCYVHVRYLIHGEICFLRRNREHQLVSHLLHLHPSHAMYRIKNQDKEQDMDILTV